MSNSNLILPMELQESDLGAVVRSLRSLYGVSQEDLAEAIDISRTAVCKIESGDRAITALEIFWVCKYFNVSPHDFYRMASDRVNWLACDFEKENRH